MSITNSSIEIFEKHLCKKINEENSYLITTINNNAIYETIRPSKEYQAHGDDTPIQISKDQQKSYQTEEKSHIPPMSSSSNEFSFEMDMRITDTSNEALKTDDENGMTKSYFLSKEKEIILSDVSLQQQLPIDECEHEIDLGNGWITKSIPSYRTDQKQQRTTSILSADSVQPITTFNIPFTNTFYKQQTPMNYSNVSSPQQWSIFSLRTVTILTIGIMIAIFLIIVVFFVI